MQKVKKAFSPSFQEFLFAVLYSKQESRNAWRRAISSNSTSLIMLRSYYKFSDVMIAKEAEAVT
jgi:hypothetical protein